MDTSQHTQERCSFCRQRESRELPLIRGADGRICWQCVAECVVILDTRNMARSYLRRGLSRRPLVRHWRRWRAHGHRVAARPLRIDFVNSGACDNANLHDVHDR
jgi:hypothetical protein